MGKPANPKYFRLLALNAMLSAERAGYATARSIAPDPGSYTAEYAELLRAVADSDRRLLLAYLDKHHAR